MKPQFILLASALMLPFLLAGTAFAQDTSGNGQSAGGQGHGMLSSLSAGDKAKFMKAREQVLANNPDLKTEQEEVTKQREAIKSEGSNATDDEKKAFFQTAMAHEKKMREAMLQIDSSLGPIFDQIDQQMKQRFQQRSAQATGN